MWTRSGKVIFWLSLSWGWRMAASLLLTASRFLMYWNMRLIPRNGLQRARELLTPGGSAVASIPNVGHWAVIADLLEGRWDYCPVGIHCVTHVRFFTEHTLRDLFLDSGFAVERLEYVKVPCPAPWAAHWAQTPGLEVQAAGWDTYAFLVRAHPIPGWASP